MHYIVHYMVHCIMQYVVHYMVHDIMHAIVHDIVYYMVHYTVHAHIHLDAAGGEELAVCKVLSVEVGERRAAPRPRRSPLRPRYAQPLADAAAAAAAPSTRGAGRELGRRLTGSA